MGFLSGLVKSVGKVAGIASPLIGHAGWSGVASALGQMYTNDQKIDLANSAYQRQVEDMKKAGLNPIMAGIKGSGASVPELADPGSVGSSQKVAAKQLALNERDVESRIDLNNSAAEKNRADAALSNERTLSESTNRQYIEAKARLTDAERTKVEKEVNEIMPYIQEKLEAEISKIKNENDRITLLKQLDQASIWQIYEMVYVAKANAESQRISANAAATSANAAMKDAKGRENAGYYDAVSGKNITSALGDLAQIIGFVVSKGRF